MTTVVWFKRDLRLDDHGPLHDAATDDVIPLYVVEPDYWQLPDTSERQWSFMRAPASRIVPCTSSRVIPG